MSIGRISGYVPPDATEAGIMPMDASGPSITGAYWIKWTDAGFTNLNWAWSAQNNPLQDKWTVNHASMECGKQHDRKKTGFLEHVTECNPNNLDALFADWDNDSKLTFLKNHPQIFMYCTTPV